MSIKKSYIIACATVSALFLAATASAQSLSSALQNSANNAVSQGSQQLESAANDALDAAKDEALGKLFPTPALTGDIVLNVTLPENTTAVNLLRKAEGESDYQLVYQAWAQNDQAKNSKGVKIEIIDYFVETGTQYYYKCNFRTLIDPNKTAYDKKNIGGSDSNEITIIPVKGYGDFKLTNTPAATYDQKTSRMTFTTLPQTDIANVKLPDGLTKQPVKFVYVNPDLYSLWINAPDAGDVPVFITLGKIQNIDDEAQMTDVELRSDDGDGGWRLSIDKTGTTTTDNWTYEEHWFRKYTGSSYGLPATIVIPASTKQAADTASQQQSTVIDAK